ncbi:hypothetical protein KY330_05755 [Candidatus Woesearchaeota archaeon]|nr:hypothetical protein [Candidatus Woesearchaeota archaeon]
MTLENKLKKALAILGGAAILSTTLFADVPLIKPQTLTKGQYTELSKRKDLKSKRAYLRAQPGFSKKSFLAKDKFYDTDDSNIEVKQLHAIDAGNGKYLLNVLGAKEAAKKPSKPKPKPVVTPKPLPKPKPAKKPAAKKKAAKKRPVVKKIEQMQVNDYMPLCTNEQHAEKLGNYIETLRYNNGRKVFNGDHSNYLGFGVLQVRKGNKVSYQLQGAFKKPNGIVCDFEKDLTKDLADKVKAAYLKIKADKFVMPGQRTYTRAQTTPRTIAPVVQSFKPFNAFYKTGADGRKHFDLAAWKANRKHAAPKNYNYMSACTNLSPAGQKMFSKIKKRANDNYKQQKNLEVFAAESKSATQEHMNFYATLNRLKQEKARVSSRIASSKDPSKLDLRRLNTLNSKIKQFEDKKKSIDIEKEQNNKLRTELAIKFGKLNTERDELYRAGEQGFSSYLKYKQVELEQHPEVKKAPYVVTPKVPLGHYLQAVLYRAAEEKPDASYGLLKHMRSLVSKEQLLAARKEIRTTKDVMAVVKKYNLNALFNKVAEMKIKYGQKPETTFKDHYKLKLEGVVDTREELEEIVEKVRQITYEAFKRKRRPYTIAYKVAGAAILNWARIAMRSDHFFIPYRTSPFDRFGGPSIGGI